MPYDAWKLQDPNDTPENQAIADNIEEFNQKYGDRVDVLVFLYRQTKHIPEEDIRGPFIAKLTKDIVEEITTLAAEMDEEWNGELPGGHHTKPDSEYYKELCEVIEMEEE